MMIDGEQEIRRMIPNFDSFTGWDQVQNVRLKYQPSPIPDKPPILDCEITCLYIIENKSYLITMLLTGVKNLKLPDDLGTRFWQINELVITDDPVNPVEGTRYSIEDETLCDFGCFCSNIEFTNCAEKQL